MKLLLWLIVIGLAAWFWKTNRARLMQDDERENDNAARPQPQPRQRPRSTNPSGAAPQQMVQCARCGLHLPVSEALSSNKATGVYYCSAEHRRLSEQ
jgi:uncharacterized protein